MSAVGTRFVLPFQTVINAIGVPWPGAQLFFYVSGTSTPLATYTDEALTLPNANPVVADSGGMFGNIFLQPVNYKVVLEDANGDEIWTADPVSPFSDIDSEGLAYDMGVFFPGKPANGQIYPRYNIVRNCFLPVGLTASDFTVNPAALPTAPATITLQKNGVTIGTIVFSVLGAPTITFPAKIDFIPGDQFSVLFPNPADATMADIALTFVFTLGT